MTEDEMIGWHHRLNGHELEQAPVVGDGQGSLACRSPWGHKELDMTEATQQQQQIYTSIFKSRGITLSAKVRLVKAMVFPIVMYEYESWTIKKAEH